MSPIDPRFKSFDYYEQRALGIPTFYKRKIMEQLKNGTYFCLSSFELKRIGYGCVPFNDVHMKYDDDNVHIKLTNSQRKQLLKRFASPS